MPQHEIAPLPKMKIKLLEILHKWTQMLLHLWNICTGYPRELTLHSIYKFSGVD